MALVLSSLKDDFVFKKICSLHNIMTTKGYTILILTSAESLFSFIRYFFLFIFIRYLVQVQNIIRLVSLGLFKSNMSVAGLHDFVLFL